MNNTQDRTFTKDQALLVAELAATYGIEPGHVHFYDVSDRPFFEHEAAAVLVRALAGATGIESEPIESVFADSLAIKCRITFDDGSFSSEVGIANFNETMNGQPMSAEQIKRLATSRAMRAVLVNAGVDLLRLHDAKKGSGNAQRFAHPAATKREKLLREVHALGYEVGLIFDERLDDGKTYTDKSSWRRVLRIRYLVEATSELSDYQLADFAAFLKTQKPYKEAA